MKKVFCSCLAGLILIVFLGSEVCGQAVPGTVKWTWQTFSSVSSSAAIAPDGTIYIGSNDNRLYAFRPDGTPKWSYTLGDQVAFASPVIARDGTIYIGSFDNKLHAVNPDGSVKWTYEAGNYTDSTPAIAADGTIYIGSVDKNLHAVNPSNGSVKWTFTTGGEIYSSPAIASDGTIYVTSRDGKLYAINPDKTSKWSPYQTGGWTQSSPAIAADGTIYIGSSDNKLYAVNPNDGSVKWTYTTGGSTAYASPAIGADGTIYIASEDHKLYAINPDGSFKWAFTAGGEMRSAPAIGADGVIYIGSEDTYVYAINPADGTQRWAYKTNDSARWSSPAIGPDGTLYIGSWDYKVYALNTSSLGLAASSWPKFRRDAQNRGFAFSFDDVTTAHWAYSYIMAIYGASYTMGYGGTNNFAPDIIVTREQMAAFVVRAKEGEPTANYCASGIPFTDITASQWSCGYIKRLFELGITTGYAGTTQYMPALNVSRAQMAAFIVRAVEGEPADNYCASGVPFTDVVAADWYCKYVKRLYELGITTGYGGTAQYMPNLDVTRAQMATFLARAFLGMH